MASKALYQLNYIPQTSPPICNWHRLSDHTLFQTKLSGLACGALSTCCPLNSQHPAPSLRTIRQNTYGPRAQPSPLWFTTMLQWLGLAVCPAVPRALPGTRPGLKCPLRDKGRHLKDVPASCDTAVVPVRERREGVFRLSVPLHSRESFTARAPSAVAFGKVCVWGVTLSSHMFPLGSSLV